MPSVRFLSLNFKQCRSRKATERIDYEGKEKGEKVRKGGKEDIIKKENQ